VLNADAALALIEQERITHVFGPPTIYQMLLAAPSRRVRDLSSLRLAQCGSANIPPDLIHSILSDLGFERVSTAYGLTEAAGTVSATSAADPVDVIANSTGSLLPGVEVRVVDEALREQPVGTSGEILVRGSGRLMTGYFGDDAPPSPIDEDGFLHTGDSGYWNDLGHLVITGRKKDMFTVGGFNVYPAEVEKVLYAHPGVEHAAVVGEPDERMGEVPVAFVVPRAGVQLAEAELMEWCAQRVANYKAPRHVVLLDQLPMTPSGKIRKSELRRSLLPGRTSA
jgi:acyl-CoA synthetase (AMP-forming)/AMP-acid ligase II